MLNEEKSLLKMMPEGVTVYDAASIKAIRKGVRALVRACYEDAAKIYLKQECEEPDPYKIAAAIRSKK